MITCAQVMEMVPPITKVRTEMEQCALENNGSYEGCTRGNYGTSNLGDYSGYCVVGCSSSSYLGTEGMLIMIMEEDGNGICGMYDYYLFRAEKTGIWFATEYEGEYVWQKKHGEGIEVERDGTRYIGEFKFDRRWGKGILVDKSGFEEEVEYKFGELWAG